MATPVMGSQTPRIQHLPTDCSSSRAVEVLELGERCGIKADPWQRLVIQNMFSFAGDGTFSAPRVGLNVPRQNGKTIALLLRHLGGIFVLGEKLITHTSQMQDTSLEAMRRLVEALEDGGLMSQVLAVRRTNGQEAIEFKDGRRIRFRTRSKSAARGWSGQCVVFDEAMFIAEASHSAAFPIISAQQQFQVVYAGSAVDQQTMEQGVVFARLREDGHKAEDPQLAYFEWSAPFDNPDELPDELNWDHVAVANPSLGQRITHSYIEVERRALRGRGAAVERYGIGDWPRTDGVKQNIIALEDWQALVDADSEIDDGLVLAIDVSPERRTWIAAAGRRADGLFHVEVIHGRGGTAWLPKWLSERVEKHDPEEVVCDGYGPVISILTAIDEAGVKIREFSTSEFTAACGRLVDAVNEKTLRHRGQDELLSALRGAKARPLGDKWAWSRKDSAADVSPLVAVTLALSAALEQQEGELVIY